MLSTFGILFLFRFGSIPPHEATLSFRAQAHQIALESSARSWQLLDVTAGVGVTAGREATAGAAPPANGIDLPLLYGAGPIQGQLRPAYPPRDWVSSVAHRLNLADHSLARAAIWLAGIPLQLDATPPSRVVVRLTLRGF